MPEVKITVESGQRSVSFCCVSANVALDVDRVRSMALLAESFQGDVPFQAEPADGGARIHWIVPSLARRQKARYVLSDRRAPAPGDAQVAITETAGEKLNVAVGGLPFTTYRYGAQDARPSLYPVIGPYGQGVTRAFPFEDVEGDNKDHKHHRSLYWAWGLVNGVDVWSEEQGHGCVRHREFESRGGGPVFGWIKSRNDWVDAGGGKLMEDRATLRFYNLPPSMRLIDFEVTLIACEGNVCLGDTKEGGICAVRVASSMSAGGAGRIENSTGGTSEVETWGKRAAWCDYSGPVAGRTVGIAIFDHPQNFRHPTYWHVRDYGLMTANPFGLSHFRHPEKAEGSHVLKAGQELAFRYRLLVHAGNAAEGEVARKYLDWIYPPAVTVEQ